MLLTPPPEPLEHAHVTGVPHEGLTITTADGRPARLAISDDEGRVIEAGPAVQRAIWRTAAQALRNLLQGQGHLRVRAGDSAGGRVGGGLD